MKKILPYKISHAIPIIALAIGSIVSSCQKEETRSPIQPEPEPEPTERQAIKYNVVLNFTIERSGGFHYDEEMDINTCYEILKDTNVRVLYLNILSNNNFRDDNRWLKNVVQALKTRAGISNKIRGMGDFHINPGLISQQDSLWLVNNGWTVNKTPADKYIDTNLEDPYWFLKDTKTKSR